MLLDSRILRHGSRRAGARFTLDKRFFRRYTYIGEGIWIDFSCCWVPSPSAHKTKRLKCLLSRAADVLLSLFRTFRLCWSKWNLLFHYQFAWSICCTLFSVMDDNQKTSIIHSATFEFQNSAQVAFSLAFFDFLLRRNLLFHSTPAKYRKSRS